MRLNRENRNPAIIGGDINVEDYAVYMATKYEYDMVNKVYYIYADPINYQANGPDILMYPEFDPYKCDKDSKIYHSYLVYKDVNTGMPAIGFLVTDENLTMKFANIYDDIDLAMATYNSNLRDYYIDEAKGETETTEEDEDEDEDDYYEKAEVCGDIMYTNLCYAVTEREDELILHIYSDTGNELQELYKTVSLRKRRKINIDGREEDSPMVPIYWVKQDPICNRYAIVGFNVVENSTYILDSIVNVFSSYKEAAIYVNKMTSIYEIADSGYDEEVTEVIITDCVVDNYNTTLSWRETKKFSNNLTETSFGSRDVDCKFDNPYYGKTIFTEFQSTKFVQGHGYGYKIDLPNGDPKYIITRIPLKPDIHFMNIEPYDNIDPSIQQAKPILAKLTEFKLVWEENGKEIKHSIVKNLDGNPPLKYQFLYVVEATQKKKDKNSIDDKLPEAFITTDYGYKCTTVYIYPELDKGILKKLENVFSTKYEAGKYIISKIREDTDFTPEDSSGEDDDE